MAKTGFQRGMYSGMEGETKGGAVDYRPQYVVGLRR